MAGDKEILILTGFDFRSDKIKMVTPIVNKYIESLKHSKSLDIIGDSNTKPLSKINNKIITTRRKRQS